MKEKIESLIEELRSLDAIADSTGEYVAFRLEEILKESEADRMLAISTNDAAALLNTTPLTIRTAIKEKLLPGIYIKQRGKMAGKYIIPKPKFAQFMGFSLEELEERING